MLLEWFEVYRRTEQKMQCPTHTFPPLSLRMNIFCIHVALLLQLMSRH